MTTGDPVCSLHGMTPCNCQCKRDVDPEEFQSVIPAARMRVLVACEFSGAVRRAFRALGHDAWSCDVIPAEDGGEHIQGDVRDALRDGWDLMIAHPPCQYLCSSGLHWNKRKPGREEKTEAALAFVMDLMEAPILHIAIENPMGRIGTAIRRADQVIQPYQFGHDASKATCLWLKRLPRLRGTQYVEPRIVNGRKRWGNQTDSGQNRLGPSPTRSQDRARTYEGIAAAMASQWGAPGVLDPYKAGHVLSRNQRVNEAWQRDLLDMRCSKNESNRRSC